jgi:hypothetical protein
MHCNIRSVDVLLKMHYEDITGSQRPLSRGGPFTSLFTNLSVREVGISQVKQMKIQQSNEMMFPHLSLRFNQQSNTVKQRLTADIRYALRKYKHILS